MRFERPGPMQLWGMDIVGGVLLVDPVTGVVREAKVVSAVDDHSRFCVIAAVVERATSGAVCLALAQALVRFGIPQEIISDNGKQFTDRFAAAAPYVDIEMYGGSARDPLSYKDAVFLSPHKLIGGPSTPGVLVVRRELMRNRVPDVTGGGTVAHVNPSEHRHLDDPAQREEGGTPAIVESIRAGLVFQPKQAVGVEVIRSHEEDYLRRAVSAWLLEPCIEILGNLDAERLSIVSFVVRAPSGRYLHHNFVVALLNDLFGVQSRGGCSCAGPYGHRLLGIDLDASREFDRELARGCEGIKPGWVRVNFNYFISETVFSYIVEAVRLVARDGWRLLGDYRFEPATGLWRHRLGPAEPPLRLGQLRYDAQGLLQYPRHHDRAPESELQRYLQEADVVFAAATPASGEPIDDLVSADFEQLRWFDLPPACLASV